jgi:hypothetical protein
MFLCGIGGLVAFIVGWMNASRWNIENVMWAWTACVLGGLLVQGLAFTM